MTRHFDVLARGSRSKSAQGRLLRLEFLEPRWTLGVSAAANFLGLIDPTMAKLVKSLCADGSISRADMIRVLQTVQREPDGVVDATNLSDLRTIVKNAAKLKMANYVTVLASDIVNGNKANASYLGKALGNLTVGSTANTLGNLIDKWFYGGDLPDAGTYSYTTASGSLYGKSGPSHSDECQGYLGDCYLISAFGSIASSSKAAIKSMFIANGDNTWTVRFYYRSKADYVTVNRKLPVDTDGNLAYQGCGWSATSANNALWLSLLEKAYAEWNETGKTGRSTAVNSYSAIASGHSDDVFKQALGYSITVRDISMSAPNARQLLINAVATNQAVVIGTLASFQGKKVLAAAAQTKLKSIHDYNVIAYNRSTGKFTLFNPWGSSQPNKVTWAQLKTLCDALAVAYTKKTAIARGDAASELMVSYVSTPNVVVSSAKTSDARVAAAKTVDALFADQGGVAVQPVAAMLGSETWRLRDSTNQPTTKASGDLFAEIDDWIDAIWLPLATF